MIDLATTNAFTLVDMLIMLVAALATGLALAWKGLVK
jgi:competence protein ComGC